MIVGDFGCIINGIDVIFYSPRAIKFVGDFGYIISGIDVIFLQP